jgi:hypothetical protein
MPTEPDSDPIRVAAAALSVATEARIRAEHTRAAAADLREQSRRIRAMRPGRRPGTPVLRDNRPASQVRTEAPPRPPPRVEHPAPAASPPPEGRNVGWATCSTCGNRYAFDHAREPGRFVVELGGSPVVVCFPACPQCGKRNTAEVTPDPPPS